METETNVTPPTPAPATPPPAPAPAAAAAAPAAPAPAPAPADSAAATNQPAPAPAGPAVAPAAPAATRELAERIAALDAGGPAADPLAQFELTENDLLTDPKAATEKVRNLARSVLDLARGEITRSRASGDLDAMLTQHAIFRDPDQDLARDAVTAALGALQTLPAGTTKAQALATVEAVARRYSQYKVQRAAPAAAAAAVEHHPVAPGAGPVETAHIVTRKAPPKDFNELLDRTTEIAAEFETTRRTGMP